MLSNTGAPAHLAIVVVAIAVAACTVEEKAPGSDTADTTETSEVVEDADVATVTLIDIEGIAVDPENTCISPDVTVLGQGPAEPTYHAPRCLRELATGTRYIARRGSAALPVGFERCPIAPVVDWPVCGQAECGGETAGTFDLHFACGVDGGEQPLPSCGFDAGIVETIDQCWYNPHTTAYASVYAVRYPPPWVRCGDTPPGTLEPWVVEARDAPCPAE